MAGDGLEDRLMGADETAYAQPDDALPVRRGMHAATKKKILLSVAALLAVAAVVGVVAGTVSSRNNGGGSSSSSNNAASSASGSNLMVVGGLHFQARPSFQPAVGSLASAPPPTVYKQGVHTSAARFSFRHTTTNNVTGKVSHTHLEYDVEKSNKAHCPSNHAAVIGVHCANPHSLGFLFANRTAALAYAREWSNGTVLFLRNEWHCGEHVRKFVSAPRVQGKTFFVQTINVTFAHAFKHASISFFTNHSNGGPGSMVTLQPAPGHSAQPAPHHQRRSLFSNLANAVTGFVTGVIQAVVTGSLSVDEPYTSSYALPSASLPFGQTYTYGSASGAVTFNGELTFNTDVNLQIQSYSVSSFSATVAAGLTATMAANMNAQGAYSSSGNAQLSKTTIASGVVAIFDIPVPLNLILSTYGGYSVSLQGDASVAGSFTAQGNMQAGVAYSGSSGSWSPIGSSSYSITPNWGSPQYTAQGNVMAYLAAELFLQAMYIGGPDATLAVYGNLNGNANSAGCVQLSADAGTEVDVGAQLSVNLPSLQPISYSTPQETVYGPTEFWSASVGQPC